MKRRVSLWRVIGRFSILNYGAVGCNATRSASMKVTSTYPLPSYTVAHRHSQELFWIPRRLRRRRRKRGALLIEPLIRYIAIYLNCHCDFCRSVSGRPASRYISTTTIIITTITTKNLMVIAVICNACYLPRDSRSEHKLPSILYIIRIYGCVDFFVLTLCVYVCV